MKDAVIDFAQNCNIVAKDVCDVVDGNVFRLALTLLIAFGLMIINAGIFYLIACAAKKRGDMPKCLEYMRTLHGWFQTFLIMAGFALAAYTIQLF